MLRHPLRALLATALVAGLQATTPVRLSAQDDRVSATECCEILLFPIGARAVGLGNALTARRGPDALFVNPAALAGLPRDEFRIHNSKTELQTSNTFGLAMRIRSAGTVGLSYRLVELGESEATDREGNVTGQLRFFEHVLLATFATHVGAGLTAGVSYALFQFRQDCSGVCTDGSFSATTHSIDMGAQFHPQLWPSLQLGVSLLHFGLPLQVVNAEQASPTPMRIRGGAAYEVLHHFSADTTIAGWATFDVSAGLRVGAESVISGGLELIFDETIFLRAGYSTGTGLNAGAAVGVGLRYERFDVGVAKTFASVPGIADPFQVTFAVSF